MKAIYHFMKPDVFAELLITDHSCMKGWATKNYDLAYRVGLDNLKGFEIDFKNLYTVRLSLDAQKIFSDYDIDYADDPISEAPSTEMSFDLNTLLPYLLRADIVNNYKIEYDFYVPLFEKLSELGIKYEIGRKWRNHEQFHFSTQSEKSLLILRHKGDHK